MGNPRALVAGAALAAGILAVVTSCGGESQRAFEERTKPDGGVLDAAEVDGEVPDSGMTTEDAGQAGAPGDPASPAPCIGGCTDDLSLRPKPLPRPYCPESEPPAREPCTEEGLVCSYGTASTAACRRFYECSQGEWQQSTDNWPETCFRPDGYCPAETPVGGEWCPMSLTVPCDYPELGLQCFCDGFRFGSGGPGNWGCYGPPEDTRCPAALPNIGEGCSERGLSCFYGVGDCRSPSYRIVQCFAGAWEQANSPGCNL